MWVQYFGQDAVHSLAEILILWFLFYYVLKTVRGTRAMQVVQFLLLLVLLVYLSNILDLTTLNWLLTAAQLPIFVGLVILYAPELRRSVSELTRFQVFRRKRNLNDPIVQEVADAAQIFSRRHIGCLIVFERHTSLQGFIDTGIKLDSYITSELLVSIFSPLTPLHDGAVILRENRIASASSLLPLSERDDFDTSLGTRHRAALGLVEETDAVTVIVSEETGAISLALNGRLTRDIDLERFPSVLSNVLAKGKRK
ncbi:TIGR00159 family protein [bacterium]|nr:TIGR00159 family protein [bacterium]